MGAKGERIEMGKGKWKNGKRGGRRRGERDLHLVLLAFYDYGLFFHLLPCVRWWVGRQAGRQYDERELKCHQFLSAGWFRTGEIGGFWFL